MKLYNKFPFEVSILSGSSDTMVVCTAHNGLIVRVGNVLHVWAIGSTFLSKT